MVGASLLAVSTSTGVVPAEGDPAGRSRPRRSLSGAARDRSRPLTRSGAGSRGVVALDGNGDCSMTSGSRSSAASRPRGDQLSPAGSTMPKRGGDARRARVTRLRARTNQGARSRQYTVSRRGGLRNPGRAMGPVSSPTPERVQAHAQRTVAIDMWTVSTKRTSWMVGITANASASSEEESEAWRRSPAVTGRGEPRFSRARGPGKVHAVLRRVHISPRARARRRSVLRAWISRREPQRSPVTRLPAPRRCHDSVTPCRTSNEIAADRSPSRSLDRAPLEDSRMRASCGGPRMRP